MVAALVLAHALALVGRPRTPALRRTAAPAMGLKDNLLSLTSGAATTALDDGTRAQVNEIILELERSSPTPQPTQSSLLNGVWTIQLPGALGPGLVDSPTRELALALYSTAYSPGNLLQLLGKLPTPLGVSLSEISVTIQSAAAGQPRAFTELSLTLPLAGEQQLRFFSNLSPVSDTRMREDVIETEVLGQRQLLPGPLARKRTLFVTYLDEDLLITRDDSGVAEVLSRKQDMSWARSSSETSKKGRGDEPMPSDGGGDAPPENTDGDEPSDM